APVCEVPSNVIVAVLSNKANLNWDDVPGAVRYQIGGRRAGTTNFRYILATSSNRVVSGLSPGITYEFQIRAACPGDTSDFSPIDSFTTMLVKTSDELTEATGLNNMSLSPNPAIDFVMVAVNAAQDGPAVLTITDLAGRTVLSQGVEVVSGQNKVTLPTGNLPNGLYLVEMRQAAFSAVSRLEVIR
ncbi:MAG: T9SS type A sorting domain-containing protein, partial [Bacteroidetes bacterium]|nr:T9SS type A sorting domain-containing protein [Bacteroidota bacterium]